MHITEYAWFFISRFLYEKIEGFSNAFYKIKVPWCRKRLLDKSDLWAQFKYLLKRLCWERTMQERLNNLNAFMVVAREQNITRAATILGISQASLSQIISKMEHQLGIKLLHRTTRSLALTEAGEQFIALIGPAVEEIQRGLTQIIDSKNKPSGTFRIVADDFVIHSLFWPKIQNYLEEYPNIHIDVISDYGDADLTKVNCDAGISRGDLIAKDMATVQISAPVKMALVGSPEYLEGRVLPEKPKDLVNHECINQRLPKQGGMLYTWKFVVKKREVKVHVNGRLTFSNMHHVLEAAEAGYGLAYLPYSLVEHALTKGSLVEMMADKCVTLPPYYIYYPARLGESIGFTKLLDVLRYSDKDK